jgi:hypothetical protein
MVSSPPQGQLILPASGFRLPSALKYASIRSVRPRPAAMRGLHSGSLVQATASTSRLFQ